MKRLWRKTVSKHNGRSIVLSLVSYTECFWSLMPLLCLRFGKGTSASCNTGKAYSQSNWQVKLQLHLFGIMWWLIAEGRETSFVQNRHCWEISLKGAGSRCWEPLHVSPQSTLSCEKSITGVKRQDLEYFVLVFTVFSCFVFDTTLHTFVAEKLKRGGSIGSVLKVLFGICLN